jgi:hypothetical protein
VNREAEQVLREGLHHHGREIDRPGRPRRLGYVPVPRAATADLGEALVHANRPRLEVEVVALHRHQLRPPETRVGPEEGQRPEPLRKGRGRGVELLGLEHRDLARRGRHVEPGGDVPGDVPLVHRHVDDPPAELEGLGRLPRGGPLAGPGDHILHVRASDAGEGERPQGGSEEVGHEALRT